VLGARWVIPVTLVTLPQASNAELTGESIISGSAIFSRPDANTTIITQSSDKLIINFDSFSIGSNETVRFIQPSASSIALNRVLGGSASNILGQLSANGSIFLVNAGGIFIAPTAAIDVSSVIATTLDIANQDFLNNTFQFSKVAGSSFGKVISEGEISVADGGYVVLAGDYVENSGIIQAKLGDVALASGNRISLDLSGDGLIQFAVDQAAVDALAGVNNVGQITANGGNVVMTAKVANDLASTVVQNSGIISAESIAEVNGEIFLSGSGGDVINEGQLVASSTETHGGTVIVQSDSTTLVEGSGSIDVSSVNGTGGQVQVLGERVGLFDQANISASGALGGGEVLIGGDQAGLNPDIQNAKRTAITSEITITADAIQSGNGGKVIVWADENTHFEGNISVKGGQQSGDGGFVEVSGKQNLFFDGTVNTFATNGQQGTLLLDPLDITIVDGAGGANDAELADDSILFADGGAVTFTIAEQTLEAVTGNVILQADNSITVNDLTDNTLDFIGLTSGNTIVFQAGGNIFFAGADDTLDTNNADLHIEGSSVHGTTGTANTSPRSVFSGTGDMTFLGFQIFSDGGTFTGNNINFGAGTTAGAAGNFVGGVAALSENIIISGATTINASGTVNFDVNNSFQLSAPLTVIAVGDINVNGLIVDSVGGGASSPLLMASTTGSITISADMQSSNGNAFALDAANNLTVQFIKSGGTPAAFTSNLDAGGLLNVNAFNAVGGSLDALSGGLLTINSALVTNGGNVSLNSGGGILLNTGFDTGGGFFTANSTNNNITFTAANSDTGGGGTFSATATGTGSISIPAGANISTNNGSFSAVANIGDVSISGLTNAGTGNITVATTTGDLFLLGGLSTSGGFIDIDIVNSGDITVGNTNTTGGGVFDSRIANTGNILFQSGTGIATSGGNILALQLGSGNVTNDGTLNALAGGVQLATTAGTVTSSSTVNAGDFTATAQTLVDLQAGFTSNGTTTIITASTGNVILAGGVTFTNAGGNNVTINAVTDIDINASFTTTGSGPIDFTATNTGGTASVETLTLSTGTLLNTNGGSVNLSETGSGDLRVTGVGVSTVAGAFTASTVAGLITNDTTIETSNGGGGGLLTLSSTGVGAITSTGFLQGGGIVVSNAGNVLISNNISQANDISVSGSNVVLSGFTTDGNATISATDQVTLSNAYQFNNGAVKTFATNATNTVSFAAGANILASGSPLNFSVNSTNGDVQLNGTSINLATGTLSITSGALVDINSALSNLGGLSAVAASDISLNSNVTTSAGNIDLTVTGAANINVGTSSIDTAGGTLTLSSAGGLNVNSSLSVTNAGLTTLQLTGNTDADSLVNLGTINTNAGDLLLKTNTGNQSVTLGALSGNNLTLFSNVMTFSGGANSISGTGILDIKPRFTAANATIDIGTVAGGTGKLVVDTAALADGFSSITIGLSDGDTAVKLGDATFNDPTLIRAPLGAGSITVNGTITLNNNGNVDFQTVGPTLILGGSLTSAGTDITITDDLQINAPFTFSSGVGAGNISLSTIDTAGTPIALTFEAGTGNVVVGNVGASIQPDSFTVTSANTVTAQQINTSGDVNINASTINLQGVVIAAGNFTASGNINLSSSVTADLGITQSAGSLAVSGSLTLTSNGAGTSGISLNDIDGAGSLNLLSLGPAQVGIVGGTTQLTSFFTDVAGSITTGSISTQGSATLISDVDINIASSITSQGGNVIIESLGGVNQSAGTVQSVNGGVRVAGSNVLLSGNVIGGSNTFSNASGIGAILIESTSALTVNNLTANAADNLNIVLDATDITINGFVASNGDTILVATNDVNVNQSVRISANSNSSVEGSVLIQADSDANGVGSLNAISGSEIKGFDITISAAEVNTTGSTVLALSGSPTITLTAAPQDPAADAAAAAAEDAATDAVATTTTDTTTTTTTTTSTGGGFDNTASAPAPDTAAETGTTTTTDTATGDTSTATTSDGGADTGTTDGATADSGTAAPADDTATTEPAADSGTEAPAEETAATADEPAKADADATPEEAVAEEGGAEEEAVAEEGTEETKEDVVAATEEEAPLEEQPLIAVADAGDGSGQACTP
jgi:trimeric autotransporter adhesin